MYRERRIPSQAYPWIEVSWFAWSFNVRHELDAGKQPYEVVASALAYLKQVAGLPLSSVKTAAEIIG